MHNASPRGTGRHHERAECVAASLQRFLNWLRNAGHTSFDQYDFWATRYGIWSRGLYYRHGKVAAPLVVPLAAADWLFPASRRWFCPKRRFPIADAHYLMGFVALYRVTGEPAHLHAAIELANALLASSIPGFSGHCWGYPFDWQTKRGLWKRGTPLITTTPYVFDAFLDLHAATQRSEYLDIARSIAVFVADDIRDTPVGNGSAASYAPGEDSQVVNASAYRAACMATAAARFGEERYRRIAARNARFVLDCQRADGAWTYSANDPQDQFIDHFHTCFVLKGLYRTYTVLGDAAIMQAVQRGYRYYRAHLFYPNSRPRPFAETENAQFRVIELYDYAEALNLALVLRNAVSTTDLTEAMATQLLDEMQTPAGFFVTRVSTGGLRNRVPYHRWAQAQAFRSLAHYYEALAA